MKFYKQFLIVLCVSASSYADTIIDSSSGNGGFVSATTSFNGSPDGWTASSGVWVDTGNSGLVSTPFGADTVPNSHFVQIHNNGGEILTSNIKFAVAGGEAINLSLDYKFGGSGSDTILTISLWDAAEDSTYAILGTINTSTDQPTFTQVDYSLTAPSANTNLNLRLTLSSGGKDVHIDRVHLTGGSIVLPPAPGSISFATEHRIEPSDPDAIRLEKAAKTIPEPKQVDWQRLEDTFFIHFGPNTFNAVEWGTGFETPNDFNPSALNAEQWVDVIYQAGGKMLMLVVKHHEGFCLYPSRYTTHDVSSSPWLGGNGDLVREVADACAVRGIKLGIYLSPADLYQIESPLSYAEGSGYYGNDSATQLSTIPTDPATFGTKPVQGRTPPAGFSSFQYEVDDYNRYFLNQLYELLTEYGDITEVWFDGANPKPGTGQLYNEATWFEMIYALQPDTCIAIGGPDVRWVGNETGYARETEWSVVPTPLASHTATDLGSRNQLVVGKTLSWFPAEADTKVLSGWFWKASHSVKTTQQLLDIYYASVGRNANLLLNLSPDTRGLIPDDQIAPLLEAYSVIRQTYATNLAMAATITAESTRAGQPASNIIDGDLDTWWEPEAGNSSPTLTLTLPSVTTFDRVVLQEATATRSQRIESFAIDARNGSGWSQIGSATTVGHKRILRVPETTTDQLRIRITQSRLEPSLAQVSLHKAATVVASPVIFNRDAAGRVSLTDPNGNAIHYTIEGSEPTTQSPLYTGPVDLPLGGTLRAISHDGSSASFSVTRRFPGVAPIGWQVISVSSEESLNEVAIHAIDDDPNTIWHTAYSGGTTPHPHQLTTDMQEARWIRGFTYLPRTGNLAGVVLTYRFEISVNGSDWIVVADGEFGNIRNSPVLQEIEFTAPVRARYFRFTSLSEVNGQNHTSAAEIGVLPGGYDAFRQRLGLQTAPISHDTDGDGLGLLMEYYLGTNTLENSINTTLIEKATGQYKFKVQRKMGVNDVTSTLRYSYNLVDWFDATPIGFTTEDQGDGTTLDTYTLSSSGQSIFYRLKVSR